MTFIVSSLFIAFSSCLFLWLDSKSIAKAQSDSLAVLVNQNRNTLNSGNIFNIKEQLFYWLDTYNVDQVDIHSTVTGRLYSFKKQFMNSSEVNSSCGEILVFCFTSSKTVNFDQYRNEPFIQIEWTTNYPILSSNLFNTFLVILLFSMTTIILKLAIFKKMNQELFTPLKVLGNSINQFDIFDPKPIKPFDKESSVFEGLLSIKSEFNDLILNSVSLQKSILANKSDSPEKLRRLIHDIHSPITALNYLKERSKQSTIDIEILNESVERLNSILLDINSSVNDPKRSSVIILENTIKKVLLEKRLLHPGIEFNIDSETNCFTKINESIFKRIVSNLLNNSIQAIQHWKGNVNIEISKNGNNEISLSISDNGKGIEKTTLEKIRANFSISDKESGSGIGLSSTYDYITNLGGSLKIYSTENIGTTIALTLPLIEKPNWLISTSEITKEKEIYIIGGESFSFPENTSFRFIEINDLSRLRKKTILIPFSSIGYDINRLVNIVKNTDNKYILSDRNFENPKLQKIASNENLKILF